MADPTNEQIVAALEAAGVRFQSFQHAITRRMVWCTSGSQPVDKLCDGIRALLRTAGVDLPHGGQQR